MANVYAVASGNWSAGGTWNTGSIPTSADTVYTNNFNVNVDTNFTVIGLSSTSNTGIAAGGTFTFNTAGVTAIVTSSITINSIGTSFILVTATTGTVTITASNVTITAAAVASSTFITYSGNCNLTISCLRLVAGNNNSNYMIRKTSTGTLTINGDMQIGGTTSGVGAITTACMVLYSDSSSTNTINGSILTGGGSNGNNIGIYQTVGTLNVTGNVNAGTASTAYGLYLSTTTTNIIGNLLGNVGQSLNVSGANIITVTGNVIGASSGNVIATSATTLNITGDVTGGTTQAISSSAGTVTITGKITGGIANGATGVIITGGTLNHVGICQASQFASAILCSAPTTCTIICTGPFLRNVNVVAISSQTLRINAAYNPYFQFVKSDFSGVTYMNQASLSFPATTNVRSGTIYASGSMTGTMIVPSPIYVRLGIATDATVGTAVITAADLFTQISISPNALAVRLRSVSTVGTTGQQLVTYNNL
jgi:hypothetical protein